jgi:hypothetical protein
MGATMPHLYLPNEHTDADLVLAADVASAVASSDLYVSWTLDSGFGAPEVEAVVRDGTPGPEVNPFAELFVAMMAGVVALWQHLANPGAQRPAQRSMAPDAGRPAGEPSY